VYFVQSEVGVYASYYRDKKVVGVFCAFFDAASLGRSESTKLCGMNIQEFWHYALDDRRSVQPSPWRPVCVARITPCVHMLTGSQRVSSECVAQIDESDCTWRCWTR
jgi:hypothetical protein